MIFATMLMFLLISGTYISSRNQKKHNQPLFIAIWIDSLLMIVQMKTPQPKWPNWMYHLLDLLVVWCLDLWALDILHPMLQFHQCTILHYMPISINHFSENFTIWVSLKIYSVYVHRFCCNKRPLLSQRCSTPISFLHSKSMFFLTPISINQCSCSSLLFKFCLKFT